MVTRSMAAAGGCDSRSSSASVRSVRTSRIGAGSSRRRAYTSRVTSRSRTCSTAAPRSRRSSRVDNGSSSRVSTNDSGSSPSIGHSSSIDDSKRSSASVGTSGRMSSPRAIACHASACRPSRDDEIGGRQRRQLAQRLQPPTFERRDRRDRRRLVRSSSLCAEARCALSVSDRRDAILFEDRRSASGASAAASSPARDDREARPREREDERGHARAGDRDVRAHAARGRLAAQLVADRARRPEQPLQPADVDRHEIVAMPLVARRELLGDARRACVAATIARWRRSRHAYERQSDHGRRRRIRD